MKYSIITGVLTVALIVLLVVGLKLRWEIGVMVIGAAIFSVICFGIVMYIWPWARYMLFLKDMATGLTREVRGSIVEISQQEDYQDGVRVLPVRIHLDSEDDERIVYLNVSKADSFPKAGTGVTLHCYGRHIKEVVQA